MTTPYQRLHDALAEKGITDSGSLERAEELLELAEEGYDLDNLPEDLDG